MVIKYILSHKTIINFIKCHKSSTQYLMKISGELVPFCYFAYLNSTVKLGKRENSLVEFLFIISLLVKLLTLLFSQGALRNVRNFVYVPGNWKSLRNSKPLLWRLWPISPSLGIINHQLELSKHIIPWKLKSDIVSYNWIW